MRKLRIVEMEHSMDVDLSSYKALYLQTAKENVSGILRAIAALSVSPKDQQAIEDVFIKSHSLKGQSMTMGYTGIAKASLAIEKYMRGIREQQNQLSQEALTAIRQGITGVEAALVNIEKNNKELPLSTVITNLEQVLKVKI